MTDDFKRTLAAWRDLDVPGSFASAPYFKKGAARIGRALPKNVNKSLEDARSYQELRTPRRRFKHRSYPALYFGQRWEADLADLGRGGHRTGGPDRRFLLVVIDVFSRKLFVRPLVRKTVESVVAAFQHIVQSLQRPYAAPQLLVTDYGAEFGRKKLATEWTSALKTIGTQHAFADSLLKGRYVERAIRSFKKVLVPYLRVRPPTESWESTVKKTVKNINARYHRTLRMAPDDVARRWREVQGRLIQAEMEATPGFLKMLHLEGAGAASDEAAKFRVGDQVLAVRSLAKERTSFAKESDSVFNRVVFTVVEVLKDKTPYLYRIKAPSNSSDKVKKLTERLYHQQELTKAGQE